MAFISCIFCNLDTFFISLFLMVLKDHLCVISSCYWLCNLIPKLDGFCPFPDITSRFVETGFLLCVQLYIINFGSTFSESRNPVFKRKCSVCHSKGEEMRPSSAPSSFPECFVIRRLWILTNVIHWNVVIFLSTWYVTFTSRWWKHFAPQHKLSINTPCSVFILPAHFWRMLSCS